MNRMSTEIENNEPKIVSVFGGQGQIKNFGKIANTGQGL